MMGGEVSWQLVHRDVCIGLSLNLSLKLFVADLPQAHATIPELSHNAIPRCQQSHLGIPIPSTFGAKTCLELNIREGSVSLV